MSEAVIFMIEQGQFALEIVDPSEVGYLDTWQGPGGVTVATATLADYDPSSATFMCQVTSGALTATADTTTVDIPASFCGPAKSIPQPGETAWSLDISILQDPNVAAGISAYLFDHDTEEAYFYLGLNGTDPPKAIGRCRLASATLGGAARTVLTADVSMPCSRKPSVDWGTLVVTPGVAEEPATEPATESQYA
jgi:hypothetical protein